MSKDVEKARAWYMQRYQGPGASELEYLAEYGAHCAREAEQERDKAIQAALSEGVRAGSIEQERDALALEVAELRAALLEICGAINKSNWPADCDHKRRTCEEVDCNGRFFSRIDTLLNEALARPTTPRVQQVAAKEAANEKAAT